MPALTVSMFWQGPLSLYEQACLLSFLAQGFAVEVYTYQALALPAGVQRRDAREVLPLEQIPAFIHEGRPGCLAALSDLFRYTLLAEHGGFWADLDFFCLRPAVDFMALQARAGQRLLVGREETDSLNTAVLIATGFHPLLARMQTLAARHDPHLPHWGTLGPHLLNQLAQDYAHQLEILPEEAFYPLHYREALACLLPAQAAYCQQKCVHSYGLHLWNHFLMVFCLPKNILPPVGSFLHARMQPLLPETIPTLPESTLQRLIDGTRALKTLTERQLPAAPSG